MCSGSNANATLLATGRNAADRMPGNPTPPPIDTLREIQTPEGIDLHLPVAGPLPRALAWLVDALIRIILYAIVGFVSAFLGRTGFGLFLVFLFLLEWFYPVVFEVLRQGQTPGKRAYGLRVLHDDGTPIGWNASLLRNLLRVVDFLPLFYTLGLLTMLLDRHFRRLGDLAAGSVVVHVNPNGRQPSPTRVRPLRPPFPLTLDEQQAIIDFADRVPHLTPERAAELAGAAAPLVQGQADPVAALQGMARWLRGEEDGR